MQISNWLSYLDYFVQYLNLAQCYVVQVENKQLSLAGVLAGPNILARQHVNLLGLMSSVDQKKNSSDDFFFARASSRPEHLDDAPSPPVKK